MAFKLNPLTGKFDLVNDNNSSATNTSFDPTPTPEMVSTNVQDAIEETDQAFSFNRIRSGKRVTIRTDRSMIASRSIQIDAGAQILIIGRLQII